jgi:hypothetical protein
MREKKIESNFWKNGVEKEISALKRVSNAEKKNRKREKAALKKKVSNARKKNEKNQKYQKHNPLLYPISRAYKP